MVEGKFEKRMKEGKLGGLNLSFVKVDLISKLDLLNR